MTGSLNNQFSLMKYYIDKGEIEKSIEQAEAVLQDNPESPIGYILMVYHYYMVGQNEEVINWSDEALQRGPEDEAVIEFISYIYQDLQCDQEKWKELVETGLRLFPENASFHAQYAHIHKATNIEQAKLSYQEAIRLKPHEELYLGNYAAYLYALNERTEAEKYEQLALQANPEDVNNLLKFAKIAFDDEKFKKAQWLIDEAMRLEPNNQNVRDSYKTIYPTKNVFIRSGIQLHVFLFKMLVGYPAIYISKIIGNKISFEFLLFLVFLAELGGLYLIIGTKSFFILLGLYFLIIFVGLRIKESMLKAAGLSNIEEETMEKEAKSQRKAALKKMKKEIAKNKEVAIEKEEMLPSAKLEMQLSEIWDSANIEEIKIEAEAKAEERAKEEEKAKEKEKAALTKKESSKNTPGKTENPTPIEWPKEYSRWPVFVMIFAIALSIIIRYVPGMIEKANRPKPLPVETQQSMTAFKEDQRLNEVKMNIQNYLPVVTQFTQSLGDENAIGNMSDIIYQGYEEVIKENIDHPLLSQLANANIQRASTSITSSYFLLVNEEENIKAVVEITFGKLTHLYAEDWSQTETEIEEYQKWLNHIETKGIDIAEITEQSL